MRIAESQLRHLVRSLLRESVIPDSDLSFLIAAATERELPDESIDAYLSWIETRLTEEEVLAALSPQDLQTIREFLNMLNIGRQDPRRGKPGTLDRIARKLSVRIRSASRDEIANRIREASLGYTLDPEFQKWRKETGTLITELHNVLIRAKNATRSAKDVQSFVGQLRKTMSPENLPPGAGDYIGVSQAYITLLNVDFIKIDRVYAEKILELLTSDMSGFIQGAELAETLAS